MNPVRSALFMNTDLPAGIIATAKERGLRIDAEWPTTKATFRLFTVIAPGSPAHGSTFPVDEKVLTPETLIAAHEAEIAKFDPDAARQPIPMPAPRRTPGRKLAEFLGCGWTDEPERQAEWEAAAMVGYMAVIRELPIVKVVNDHAKAA